MALKKQTVLGIFAHPDDEAFGPGGTLAILSETSDVYLICVTDGNNPGVKEDLTEIRRDELRASAGILGVKDVFFFGYQDGSISNSLYHQIAGQIEAQIKRLKPNLLITFEPRGVSGHIDHMGLSMIVTFVFERHPEIPELWYYCILKSFSDGMADYFIYFPDGYRIKEVDKIVDVSAVWDTKVKAMQCHLSQIKDVNNILKRYQKRPKEEYFLVKTHRANQV